MRRLPSRSTRTDTPVPYTTRFRSLDYVAGYCIGLDMTMQGSEFPSFGKSFDTYGVMGPWLTTRDEIADPDALSYCLKVNGEDRSEEHTSELQSLMRRSYAVFFSKKKTNHNYNPEHPTPNTTT